MFKRFSVTEPRIWLPSELLGREHRVPCFRRLRCSRCMFGVSEKVYGRMALARPVDTDYQAMPDDSEHGETPTGEGRARMVSLSRRQHSPQERHHHGEGSTQQEEQLLRQGNNAGKGRKSKLRTVAGYIIVTEFCERLAYYGLSGGDGGMRNRTRERGLCWLFRRACCS